MLRVWFDIGSFKRGMCVCMLLKGGLGMEFPNKKYQIIYADPPWSYKDKALAGNRGAGCKYKTQRHLGVRNNLK